MPIKFQDSFSSSGESEGDLKLGDPRRHQSIYDRNSSIYGRRPSRRGSIINPAANPPPAGVLVNSDRAYSVVSEKLPDFTDLHDESREGLTKESEMGFWQGLKTYPNAAAWSVLLSSSIIMEGYDTNLLGGFFAFPQFKQVYGSLLADGQYQITAGWQIGLTNGGQVGSLIGLLLNGVLCDKIGYKKTYFIAMAMMTAFIFLPFFATGVGMLMAGQVLSGIPWGMFQTLSVAYASEVCPVCLRGYLTTYANICWVVGQVLSSGVLRAMLSRPDEWSYRIPFALQWIFIPPIVIGVVFAPESPWWLVRQGRLDDAAKVVRRLMAKAERSDENNVVNKISEMKLTNEHEKALSAGTNYWDCFRGIDLRRTEVACLTWAAQNMSGSALMGFSTFFYTQAGLPTEQAYNFTLGQYALGFFGTLGSWILMSYFGRRSLYIAGLCAQLVVLAVIGGLGFAPPNTTITQAKRSGGPSGASSGGATIRVNTGASWAVGSLLLIFTLLFDLTVGPVCYAIVGECSSTRLRQKTIVMARMVYNICGIIINGEHFKYLMVGLLLTLILVITPIMLNPGAANLGAKTGLVWAGITVLCIVWCYFRLPETGRRTYQELTILFENRVSARKFQSTKVDQFRSTSIVVERGDTMEEMVKAAKTDSDTA